MKNCFISFPMYHEYFLHLTNFALRNLELHSINTRPPLQLMSKVESESLLNYTADNYCPY